MSVNRSRSSWAQAYLIHKRHRKSGISAPLYQRMIYGISVAVIVLILSGCTTIQGAVDDSPSFEEGGKLRITATTGMIADAAREVGGEHVTVTGLMGPGVDPHMYKASQGDIRKLDDADLVLYNGLHLEGSMTKIMEKMSKSRHVVAVAENIDPAQLRYSEDGATEYDPHIWFDVSLWINVTQTIEAALIEADPAHEADYRQNATQYLTALNELHQEVQSKIASIPESGRVLITAHDAFGYYGDAYNIEVKGLQGISTAAEYGSKDVSDLRNELVERGIKAVFVESSVPSRSMEAIIAGAQSMGHTVQIGGELFSDAMGEAGTIEGTYIGMVRHNTDTIVEALK